MDKRAKKKSIRRQLKTKRYSEKINIGDLSLITITHQGPKTRRDRDVMGLVILFM